MNIVSLGYRCQVSSAMRNLGIRKFAGPFDWHMSKNIKWVIELIQNNFEDFLNDNIMTYVGDRECDSYIHDLKRDVKIVHPSHFHGEKTARAISDTSVNELIAQHKIRSQRVRDMMDLEGTILFVRESPITHQEDPIWILKSLQDISTAKILLMFSSDEEPPLDLPEEICYIQILAGTSSDEILSKFTHAIKEIYETYTG